MGRWQLEEATQDLMALLVADGVTPEERIVELALDEELHGEGADDDLDEDEEEAAEAAVWQELKELLAGQRHEQKSWPRVTDCDRLDNAFERLRRQGWAAIAHAEGPEDVSEEMTGHEGAIFYDVQGVHAAMDGEDLSIHVHAAFCAPETTREMLEATVKALKGEGLEPSWDGNIVSSVKVPIDWQRRR